MESRHHGNFKKKEGIYLGKNHLTLGHETYFQHVFSRSCCHIYDRDVKCV